jgi:hypothetical protein
MMIMAAVSMSCCRLLLRTQESEVCQPAPVYLPPGSAGLVTYGNLWPLLPAADSRCTLHSLISPKDVLAGCIQVPASNRMLSRCMLYLLLGQHAGRSGRCLVGTACLVSGEQFAWRTSRTLGPHPPAPPTLSSSGIALSSSSRVSSRWRHSGPVRVGSGHAHSL